MRFRYLSFVVPLFVVLGFFMAVSHVDALKIGPTVIDLSANPGESLSGSVLLENDSDTITALKPTTLDARADINEGGYAAYDKPTETSTLSKWLSFKDIEITLQPREKRNAVFFVNVPKEGSVGGHYAAIGWLSDVVAPKESGAAVGGFPVVNIALDVLGKTVEKGDVVSFSTINNKSNYDKLPVSFVTRINNGGNRHFKPQGSIQVKNMFGSVVANLPLNETNGGGNVLPMSTREFNNEWVGEFAFGKYTAVLTANLAGAGTKTASYELWVMPAGLLVLWLIIALIIIVILVLLIKRAMQSSSELKK